MRRRGMILALAAAVLAAAPAAVRAADPPPVMLEGPSGPTNDNTPTFTFTSQDTTATFKCRLDVSGGMPGTDEDCTSPRDLGALADGGYTFTVSATGDQGAPPPASLSFTVDTVPPETTIVTGPPALTNRPSVTFSVSSSDDGSTFECKLTGPGHTEDFAACDATTDYAGLAEGDYTFSARAKDPAGNMDDSPATQAFSVDLSPPAAPAISGTPAAFTFSSEPGAAFACALDTPSGPGTFAQCTSPVSFSGLAPGAYTLRVHAIDAAGNPGPDAALGFTVAAPQPSPPAPIPTPSPKPAPEPVFHRAVVARPGLADVRVRLPGSSRYARLTADRALPLGSVLDTRRGAVQLVSVPRRGARSQRASFDGAVFRVTQPGRTTVLTLVGPCHPARQLSGNGHGSFEVRGRYSDSSVRGTRWVVRDSCSGTLTRAIQGVVQVRDKTRRRTVLVRAGRRYLARPKG